MGWVWGASRPGPKVPFAIKAQGTADTLSCAGVSPLWACPGGQTTPPPILEASGHQGLTEGADAALSL